MRRENTARVCAFVGLLSLAFSGCRIPVDTGVGPGTGGGGSSGPVKPQPKPTPTATPPPGAQTCVSSDPDRMCIGLKIVSYVDSASGLATLNEADAKTLVKQVNNVWSACDIAFQLEDYRAVDPAHYGLEYGYKSEGELNDIRETFEDYRTFLVVVTGPWSGRTIAWTTMPGGGPFGTIVEKEYGHNAYTVGHELGHYMGLYHINSSSNLMNAYIGSNTSGLSSNQCGIARETNLEEWQPMLR